MYVLCGIVMKVHRASAPMELAHITTESEAILLQGITESAAVFDF